MRGTRRLSPLDVLRTAWLGISGRPQRTALAALGIALGIAALTALTGAAASNRAQLLIELDRMGADLAVVAPGVGPDQELVPLPESAPQTISRQPGVDRVGVLEAAPAGLAVYRSDLVPEGQTNSLRVLVARPDLMAAVDATLASGRWFDEATRTLPVTVLGATAAERLGVAVGDRVWLGDQWYGVVGILDSAGLAADLDAAAILGDAWVREELAGTGLIEAVYVRAEPGLIAEVRAVLAAAANPGSPFVSVSAVPDLAQARDATDDSLSTLGVVLGGIALLVGGVGIANTMVVAVMERRGEIGLRRSLGARPGQIAGQFVTEAVMLSSIGGLAGLLLGSVAAGGIAVLGGQPVVLPSEVLFLGPALSVVVGALAGLHPALRAARLTPTEALRAV